jgi:hypothetical protein
MSLVTRTAFSLSLFVGLAPLSCLAQQKTDIQGFYPGMTLSASQANELEHKLKCLGDIRDYRPDVILNIYTGTMGVRTCRGTSNPPDELNLVFSLLIKEADVPLLVRIKYQFYTAFSPKELVSSISRSYSSPGFESLNNDDARAKGFLELDFMPIVGWQLTNDIFLALGPLSRSVYSLGVRPWLLAVWDAELLSRHRQMMKTKERELHPLPKLD